MSEIYTGNKKKKSSSLLPIQPAMLRTLIITILVELLDSRRCAVMKQEKVEYAEVLNCTSFWFNDYSLQGLAAKLEMGSD